MKRGTAVLVSGWAHAADDLAPLSDRLARRYDVRTLSPADLLAFARGGGPARTEDAGAVSPYAHALRFLAAEIENLSCLAGWSMGALIAIEALGRLPRIPEKVVILGGTPRFCNGDGHTTGVPLQNLRALRAGLRRDPAKALGGFFRDVAKPRTLSEAAVARKTGHAIAAGVASLEDGLEYLQATDVREVLARLSCPALVLHGRQDGIVPWEAGAALAGRMPRGVFGVYEDAGHDLLAAVPDTVCSRVLQFLEA